MGIVIKASAVVAGDDMEVLRDSYVIIEDGLIVEVGQGQPSQADEVIEAQGCVVIPGLINAHVHVGDSAFKDAGFGKTLNELFKPPEGLKHQLLTSTPKAVIVKAIKDTLTDMLRSGVTTLADFREGGIEGVKALLEATDGLKIKTVIFGRLDYTFTKEQLETNKGLFPDEVLRFSEELLTIVHGLGPSSPNDLTDESLKQLASIAKKHGKLKAIHAAEHPASLNISKSRTGLTEVERSLKYFEADLLVHLTYARPEDLNLVADRGVSVVCCPRANAALGLKLPPILEMLDRGINVALGTDNVMLTSPDMFREMEFTIRAYNILGIARSKLKPVEVFKMATINGAKALKVDDKIGSIEPGKVADLVLLNFNDENLRYTNNIITAIVHRARPSNVRYVLIGGEIVYDRDMEIKRRNN